MYDFLKNETRSFDFLSNIAVGECVPTLPLIG